jgi:hypothetical protein
MEPLGQDSFFEVRIDIIFFGPSGPENDYIYGKKRKAKIK